MNHIKDNWVENEVFHASNLNEIAKTINALEDSLQAPTVDEVIEILNEPESHDGK